MNPLFRGLLEFARDWLGSNRVRALALAGLVAISVRYLSVDEQTAHDFINALIVFILGDTIRPINARKAQPFLQIHTA